MYGFFAMIPPNVGTGLMAFLLRVGTRKVGDNCFSVEKRQQPSGFTFALDLESVSVVQE